jgi:hypothetical protein
MTPPKDLRELLQLLGELADDLLSDAGSTRLAELLRDDPAARRYYLDYMEIHARLAWKHGSCDAEEACSADAAAAAEVQGQLEAGDDRPSIVNSSSACVAFSPATVIRGSSNDGSLSAGHSWAGALELCYVLAVTIAGVGLAVASAYDVLHFQTIAKQTARPAPAAGISEPGFEGKTGSNFGNGRTTCASATELPGYGMDAKHQPNIAISEKGVARTE